MPTVTFQCGSCRKLMAVEDKFLGQQVRCPHCQQVLVAPVSTSMPSVETFPKDYEQVQEFPFPDILSSQEGSSSETSKPSPPLQEHESIFAPTTEVNEDLFGMHVPGSVMEIPPEPDAHLPLSETTDERPSPGQLPRTTSETPHEAFSMHILDSAATPVVASPKPVATPAGDSAANDWPVLDSSSLSAELPPEMAKADLTRQAARRAKRESLFTTYLIIILIPYAIFASCVAAYFYWRMMQMPHPLEYLRDTGENPPAKRGASSVQEIISPETSLPPKLHLALGEVLRIGDLEIQPQRVERRKITICSEAGRLPQLTATEALVLTMRLRNISQDVFFTPTDPVFDRRWRGEPGTNRPYAFLDVGGSRFFGGPIKWSPRTNPGKSREGDPREYVKGQEHDNQTLKPGEERISVFCTDPDNREILRALKNYQGPLVWRVHLRRGLVQLADREVSATAVIGVVFDKKDIVSGL